MEPDEPDAGGEKVAASAKARAGALRLTETDRSPTEFLASQGLLLHQRTEGLAARLRHMLVLNQILLDRRHDDRLFARDTSDLSAAYRPECRPVFPLEGYWLDATLARRWEAPMLSPALRQRFVRSHRRGRELLLLVHPESASHYGFFLRRWAQRVRPSEGPELIATPTASSRTLLVWPSNSPASAFVAKLSLAAHIGAVDRTIRSCRVPKCVGITALLDGADDLPQSFAYDAETYGLAPRFMRRGGMILRELRHAASDSIRVPLFALYATPSGDSLPLLIQLARAARVSPMDYALGVIAAPFARHWLDLAVDSGIVTEPHAQNLQLEFDARWSPTGRFVHRDLEDVSIDLAYRQRRQLFVPPELPHLQSVGREYAQRDHRRWIRQSLRLFFEGGVLQPLERAIRGWSTKGLFVSAPPNGAFLRQEFRAELARALGARGLGKVRARRLVSEGDYEALDRWVLAIRG